MGAFRAAARRVVYGRSASVVGCLGNAVVVVIAMMSGDAKADLIGHGGMVRDVAISADGRQVLTASFDYSAILWKFADQAKTQSLDGHDGPVNAVAFLPDGERALSGGDDGRVITWHLPDGKAVSIRSDHDGKVAAVAVSPRGTTLASAGWDGTVQFWPAGSATPPQVLEHDAAVTALAFSQDNELITGDRDGALHVWNTATGEKTGAFQGHSFGVTDLVALADGKRVVSAGIDGVARVWSLDDRRELAVFEGHEGPIYAVAVSRDGMMLLSSGQDGAVLVWLMEEKRLLQTIFAHDNPVWGLALTPDGRFAISASSDESARVWHLATGTRVGPTSATWYEAEPWLESAHPGARLYRSCAICHALSAEARQRSGPHFAGLFGRRAGSVPGYDYSQALKNADVVWNEETLQSLFKIGPEHFVPGTKMPLQRISDDADLAALIDYMRVLTANAGPH